MLHAARVPSLMIVVVLSSTFVSSPAVAYLCTGVPNGSGLSQAWNQRCLPYFINKRGTLLEGDARRQLIAQSFSVWSAENCTDLDFVDKGYTNQEPGFDPGNPSENENVIVSIEDPQTAGMFFTRGELAITLTSFNTATGEIFDADILINNASFPFEDVSSVELCRTESPLPYDLRNTLIHEIGHFIGFEHDPDPESTMFASAPECEIKKRDLTNDNVLGLCTVYATGQPTRTCGPPESYDIGPGDPSKFRDQCNRQRGGGCSTTTPASERSAWWCVVLLPLAAVRRRRVSGR